VGRILVPFLKKYFSGSTQRNQGTTLVEVLVSLVMVAITTLGGIALYFSSTELQAIALHKKMAIELANSQMEECRRPGCDAGSSDIAIGGLDITNGMTIEDRSSAWTGYDTKVVKVGWNESDPASRDFNVSFTTLVPQ